MFERTQFVIRQLQRLKAAMEQEALAGFAPDGRDAAYVAARLNALEAALTDVTVRLTAQTAARGAVDVAWEELHGHCVAAAAAMRSVYRGIAPALRAIQRIPAKDESPRSTLARAAVTGSTWAKLPPMPNTVPPESFKVGALTLPGFKYFIEVLQVRMEAAENCSTDVEFSREALMLCARDCGELVSAAVAQGRARFPEGTAGRGWIETIPLELGTQPPLEAEITLAESPAPGAVHLEFEARYATSFTVLHRLGSDVEFAVVAEDVEEEFWDANDLPPGDHEYIVQGVNSRGTGKPSEIATVPVATVSRIAA